MNSIPKIGAPAPTPTGHTIVPRLCVEGLNRDTPITSARAQLAEAARQALDALTPRPESVPPAQEALRNALAALRKAWAAADRAVRMEENKNPNVPDEDRRALYQRLLERDLQATLHAAHLRAQASIHLSPRELDEASIRTLETRLDTAELPLSARMQAAKRLADQCEHAGQPERAMHYLQRGISIVPREAYSWE